MNKYVAPHYKEIVLTTSTVAPFVLLLGTEHVDKSAVWSAFYAVLFWYIAARVIYKIKTGTWQWKD